MRRRYIPQYQNRRYSVSPLSLYNAILVNSALNNITQAHLSGMDYGSYMEQGDGLGYDDVSPYNYGYEECLSGIFSSIGTFISKAGGTIGSVASDIFNFSAKYAVKGFDITKKIASSSWSVVKKLPSVGVKAWDLTSKAASVGWKAAKSVAVTAYKWTGWKKIGGATVKFLGAVVVGGLEVGAWVLTTAGEVLFTNTSGQVTQAPAGVTPPKANTATTPSGEQAVIYTQAPSGGGAYQTIESNGQYLPVDLNSGWVVDPTTGEPVRQATEEELVKANEQAQGKKNIWGYIAAAGAAALVLFS